MGFWHQQSATERDDYVIINWQNIEPGNAGVFTHKKHNKDAPVPCTQLTHKDITFTPHPSHHYVQQQWLFKQRASIAGKILMQFRTEFRIIWIKSKDYVSLLTFRHRASCILGQAFHYSPENAFYIFNQQIYFII